MTQQQAAIDGHALGIGEVVHQRLLKPKHRFGYRTQMLWLDLDRLDRLQRCWRKPWVWLRRDDYLGQGDLKAAVLKRMSELAGEPLQGQLFLLGQVRYFGLYFSPVNFYLLKQNGQFTQMLAEVSNTPWNQRHHYLVPLAQTDNLQTPKRFHVSPFMPAELGYRWRVQLDDERIRIGIHCHRAGSEQQGKRAFWAAIDLTLTPLNQGNFNRVMRTVPWATAKTVAGIYFEALRLLLKRARFYPHSGANGDIGCSSK
ncbi:DUF1365 domain-containing protein [Ferrimonas senticii]|uniref:DUF1365 domain-containing protein n=1 Tax=Ferrimonas senticii TaxID=394566 RepID=UPI0004258BF8|nr:DUF1365 domain-containing protein [Ferrimonas senticii]